MSKLKYYYDLMSQPSRAVLIFLELNKIAYQGVPVALRKGEHLTEDYKKNVNRFRKVPCINDDGFKLSESVAILRYLTREHQLDDHWYPKDLKQRALIDEYLEWQHINLRTNGRTYFRSLFTHPILVGQSETPDQIEQLKQRFEASLDILENVWLAHNRNFLTGDQITIADIMAACEIEQPTMIGYNPYSVKRPQLAAWLDRVKAATNPVYELAHKTVREVAIKTKLYFAREHKIADHWYPKNSKEQAQVDEWMEWQHHNLRAHCSLYFRAKWITPLVTGKPESPGKLELLRSRMDETLDMMENIWLAHDKKFMITDSITIADLLAACEVEQPTMAGYNPCTGRPRLTKWLANVKQATNPVYDDAHKIVYKVAAASSKL